MDSEAYVPGFTYDVFISYAHLNREWVQAFDRHVRNLLGFKSGRYEKIKVWRDDDLKGICVFDSVIGERIRGSALFVAVISKGYDESDYCREELSAFHAKARDERAGLSINNSHRIFNVFLQHLPHPEWYPEFEGTTGYRFHDATDRDPAWSGYPLKPDPDTEAFDEAAKRPVDDLHATLETFREIAMHEAIADSASGSESAATSGRLHVPEEPADDEFQLYLASVSSHKPRKAQKAIVRSLKQEGVSVMSGLPPPYDPQEHDSEVIEKLRQAQLSIHMLDHDPGPPMDDESGMSYPIQQAQLGPDHASNQLICLPRDLHAESIDQDEQPYRNRLSRIEHEDSAHRFSADEPAEIADELSNVILERVDALRRRRESFDPVVERSVLVDVNQKDMPYGHRLVNCLLEKGLVPHFVPNSDQPEAASHYENVLKRVATVIMLFGHATELWVKQRMLTMLNRCATGRYPVRNAAIFLCPPRKSIPPDEFGRSAAVDMKLTTYLIDNMDSDTLQPDRLPPILD